MNTKHTPGPLNCWPYTKILQDKTKWIISKTVVGTNNERVIAECSNQDDATLYAAAPELLEALQNAANVLAAIATGQLKGLDKESYALLQARAAIAKATNTTKH